MPKDSPAQLDGREIQEVRATAAMTEHVVRLDLPEILEIPDLQVQPDLSGLLETRAHLDLLALLVGLGILETRDLQDNREIEDNLESRDGQVLLEIQVQLVGLDQRVREVMMDLQDLQATRDLLVQRDPPEQPDLLDSRVTLACLVTPDQMVAAE